MKYKCCSYLKNGIHFTLTGVRFCNKIPSIGTRNIVNYSKDFYKNFFDIKKQILEECKQNIVPEICKNCIYLEEKEWDSDTKINFIEIFHWNQCNCACIYCGNRVTTKLKKTFKKVDGSVKLYKTLKTLIKNKEFDDNVNISFGGGEPTLLKEFPDILKLFMEQKYNMHLLTNGILYEKLFSKFLKQSSNNYITISLDCGTREMYRRIKGVDKFQDVINNIKRYLKESGENSKNLFLKYILIEGLNDNEEEIIKWLELCKSLGIKTLHPSIEFCHSAINPNKKRPSDHICDMYNFMKEKIEEYGFNLNTYDFVEIMIKNKSYR